jgi:hypothetical protein
MSIDNNKVFPLLAGKKAMIYDSYYLIFGLSEIRIKLYEKILYSNFGNSNGHFDSLKHNADVLLGIKDSKEVKMTNYEIYSLSFE